MVELCGVYSPGEQRSWNVMVALAQHELMKKRLTAVHYAAYLNAKP